MPNNDTPFGLRPVRHRNGAAYNGAVNYYYVPASDAAALFTGDPVTKTGASNTAEITAPGAGHFQVGTLPEVAVTVPGASNRITGVVVGVCADPDGLGRTYKPASTQAVVAVCDDPDIIFEIQANGTIAPDQMGLNALLVADQGGSTSSGLSGFELDAAAPATTVGFQLNMIRAVNREDNAIGENFGKIEVRINQHSESNSAVAGV